MNKTTKFKIGDWVVYKNKIRLIVHYYPKNNHYFYIKLDYGNYTYCNVREIRKATPEEIAKAIAEKL